MNLSVNAEIGLVFLFEHGSGIPLISSYLKLHKASVDWYSNREYKPYLSLDRKECASGRNKHTGTQIFIKITLTLLLELSIHTN